VRILFVTSWYPTKEFTYGGVFVREHAKAVRASGNEVVVLHVPQQPTPGLRKLWMIEEERDPELSEGIPAYHVWHRRLPLRGFSYPLYLRAASRAYRRIRESGFEPDVIHAHVYGAGVPAIRIGKREGIPVVVTEQFTGFPRRTLDRAEVRKARYVYENAALGLPVSLHLQRSIEAYDIHGRFEVVPNVVDTSLFFSAEHTPKQGEPKRMVFVGNLEPTQHKGFPILLSALVRLGERRSDWRLDVIGEGPERPEYERRVEAAGLSAQVTFHGARPKAAIAEMMRGSDLFVLPSRFDNLPCVIVEALASGLPVVSTTVGGIPEMVYEGAGVLVAPDDAPALADALDRVLSNLGSFDRAKTAAAARSSYSLEAVGARLQSIYESVLSESGRETTGGEIAEPARS
jgi:glycosyltransferase involved in cell wall biosynthesis